MLFGAVLSRRQQALHSLIGFCHLPRRFTTSFFVNLFSFVTAVSYDINLKVGGVL